MWIYACVIVGVVLFLSHWLIYKWANPHCNGGVLPPGSMGLPLIGETIQLIIPSYSLDIHPFITRRVQRYGPIFRTCLAGLPIVVSVDPEFNDYILQQEGKSTELWYMRTISKLLSFEDDTSLKSVGQVHKYIRSLILNHYGFEALREKLLPQMEEIVRRNLTEWSSQPSIEVKQATSKMASDLSAKLLFGNDSQTWSNEMRETLATFSNCFISFPLNIPGTTYYKCLKGHKRFTELIRSMIRERMASESSNSNDLLDQVINDMKTGEVLPEDFLVQVIFVTLLTSSESISTSITVLLELLSGNNNIVEQLKDEHTEILEKRRESRSTVNWDEYKSMTFTSQVINETLRLGNLMPGLFRRAVEDIQLKGITIPAGWSIMLVDATRHVNPDIFRRPLEFNPGRWKELESHTISKHFMPFGGGMRQCVGADYTKVFLSVFLHVLVMEFRWTKIKGGKVYRNPFVGFKGGLDVKFSSSTTMK